MLRLKSTRGRVLDPLGLPLRLGGSAGPRSPSGIRQRAADLTPHWLDGPGAAVASPEVDEAGDGGGRVARATSPALNWRGSTSILMAVFTLWSSSCRNSADLMEDVTSALHSTMGARGWRASASRVSLGGRTWMHHNLARTSGHVSRTHLILAMFCTCAQLSPHFARALNSCHILRARLILATFCERA